VRANRVRTMTAEDVATTFEDANLALAIQSSLRVFGCLQEEISVLEETVLEQVKLRPGFRKLMTVPGIGRILALTIMLETGDIDRFRRVGNYVSYCRLVGSSYVSNDKRKGAGNTKNGNAYLCWAFIEAANFAIRHCASIRRYYQRKAARTKRIVALKTVGHKLGRACYYIMKDQVDFDSKRAFG
jgi:transposase